MLCGLVYLSWFDLVSVALTFLTTALVQLLSVSLAITTTIPTTPSVDATTTTTSPLTTASTTTTTNGKVQKQKSEQKEDVSSPSSSSPPLSARNSISLPHHNGSLSHPHPPSIDCLSDEYHEDEDTLSLENLFPCDQSEIYASKKISFIIDELIQTEANYVNNLRKGVQNYGSLQERPDLPEALQDAERRQQLLSNIEEILALHEQHILPLMLRNQRDLRQLFDEFAAHFEVNWHRAAHICAYQDMTLAQIATEEANDLLMRHLNSFGLLKAQYWLSANDLAMCKDFNWLTDGRPLSYTNWGTNQSSYSGCNNRCVHTLASFQWSVTNCLMEHYFICEQRVKPFCGIQNNGCIRRA